VDGWTFEPPNVQVTELEAVQAVCAAHGGRPEDYRRVLRYETIAGEDAAESAKALRRDKVLLLYYTVWNQQGAYVTVDSVTGEVVNYRILTPGGLQQERAEADRMPPAQGRGIERPTEPVPEPDGVPVGAWAAGLLATAAGAVIVARFLRR
jgi:alkanesulfonate monooxygenase SsuD/methylene tetrahydromethanopterin reductase-like flavin-dependent oxidoreductase (luciferase family)